MLSFINNILSSLNITDSVHKEFIVIVCFLIVLEFIGNFVISMINNARKMSRF